MTLHAHTQQPNSAQLESITAYYDHTWIDYRTLWLNRDNLAIHFGYYDTTTRSHASALIRMNQMLAQKAAILPGQRVLDAGCGIGGSSFWLAQNYGVEVVGINVVAGQVAHARHTAQARGLTHKVTFQQTDYTDTPFADASFDVVWSLESLCHAPQKAAFYREAARLLRPGGRLIVAEYIRTARPLASPDESLLHQWLDGWAIPDLDTWAEHRTAATTAGLGQVQCLDITMQMQPSLQRLYQMARWCYPIAIIARQLGIRSAEQHGNVVGALRQYQALARGLWCYGILSAVKPVA